MFFFVSGTDVKKSQPKFNELADGFLNKRKGSSLFKLDDESFSLDFFNDLMKTENLFGGNVVAGRRLLENTVFSEYFMENAATIAEAKNVFIFWEEAIKEPFLPEIKKHAEAVYVFDVKSAKSSFGGDKKNNPFKIADFISSRQREKAWVFFQEQLMAGLPAEEIFWKIFWQVKVLSLIKKGEGCSLNQFVYRKNISAGELFSEPELNGFMDELVHLYHRHKLGLADLPAGIERFILRI